MSWHIIEGDARHVLAEVDDGSVQTCVTSPPYFGLRDYDHGDQIGLEETPAEYVAHLVDVFREVRRVLRNDGTVWLNLGDSYASRAQPRSNPASYRADRAECTPGRPNGLGDGVKNKDLYGMPWRVALALQDDGWYLRSDVIWEKPNAMPESVTDRPTRSHEYVFLLTKSQRYYYDGEAIKETDQGRNSGNVDRKLADGTDSRLNTHLGRSVPWEAGRGRNKRSVWTIPTRAYPGAHFATFPEKLVEPCVLAGSSHQACGTCGAPWKRILAPTGRMLKQQNGGPGTIRAHVASKGRHGATSSLETGESPEMTTIGWEPTCGHTDATGRCLVLDPFAGAGTTAIVSLLHERRFVGVELNPGYIEMATERIQSEVGLFA